VRENNDWFKTSDTVVSSVYVDYSTPYTLNVRRPLIGTAQANTTLAPDGTLTQAEAQTQDQTLSTLLGMVPAIGPLMKALGGQSTGTAPSGVTFDLAIEPRAVSFTRQYHIADLKPPCEAATSEQLKEDGRPYFLTVEDVGADKKPKAENGIKVDATITLPKPEAKKD
jgi:hypothetical protein